MWSLSKPLQSSWLFLLRGSMLVWILSFYKQNTHILFIWLFPLEKQSRLCLFCIQKYAFQQVYCSIEDGPSVLIRFGTERLVKRQLFWHGCRIGMGKRDYSPIWWYHTMEEYVLGCLMLMNDQVSSFPYPLPLSSPSLINQQLCSVSHLLLGRVWNHVYTNVGPEHTS